MKGLRRLRLRALSGDLGERPLPAGGRFALRVALHVAAGAQARIALCARLRSTGTRIGGRRRPKNRECFLTRHACVEREIGRQLDVATGGFRAHDRCAACALATTCASNSALSAHFFFVVIVFGTLVVFVFRSALALLAFARIVFLEFVVLGILVVALVVLPIVFGALALLAFRAVAVDVVAVAVIRFVVFRAFVVARVVLPIVFGACSALAAGEMSERKPARHEGANTHI
ncbi:TPA: hypothetical protein QDB07_003623 [Burkholderia vietnamiensis]|nr:hypothetical protein [Burkholderia vietnamiensis]